jgi:hypothetical protein
VIAEQPAKWADEVAKYFGPSAIRREGSSIVADTGSHHIRYVTREDYAQRYPGITPVRPGDHPALLHIRVDNLPTCEALLKRNGVKVLTPNPGRVLVPPSEAAHLTIEFAER